MSVWLDAVASEAMEALAEEETPGNGERKVILCFIQSINRLQQESSCIPGQCYMMNLDGDIEVDRDDVSGRETDWKGDGLGDMRSGRAVKELKLNRRNRFGRKVVILTYLESMKQWLER